MISVALGLLIAAQTRQAACYVPVQQDLQVMQPSGQLHIGPFGRPVSQCVGITACKIDTAASMHQIFPGGLIYTGDMDSAVPDCTPEMMATFINVAKGEKGDQGVQGVAGAQGVKGDPGAVGAKGDTGSTGATGNPGVAGANGADGQPGLAGPMGPVGQAGAKGDAGATGAVGPMGPVGPSGAPGSAGSTGATGAPGATGPAGVSYLTAVSASLGGAALGLGVNTLGTVSVTGAVKGRPCVATATDGTDMNTLGGVLTCAVTNTGQVTLTVRALLAFTPPAKTYNVIVFP